MAENEKARDQIRIVAICGSLRPGSYTRMALQVALRGARETGAEATLIDLRDYQLIFCDGKEDESKYPKDVFRLREEVKGAHGLILGTPEYHGGLSGVLKNALDLMGFEELEGKMIGLVGVSGGTLGAVHALSHLRTVGRALHAWVIPEQAAVSEAWKAFDEKRNLKNPEIEKRLLDLGRQVARFSYLHTSEKALEFLRLWESAPMNPGA
jgi:FMN reductase